MTPLPIIDGGYGAILADPPWRFETRSAKGRGRCPDGQSRAAQRENRPENHYATMSPDNVLALPVQRLAAPDCVLFLWAVDPLLPLALKVGAAWGFTYKTTAFVWAKERRETSTRAALHTDPDHKRFPIGTGYWTRANPELCLLFTRGRPTDADHVELLTFLRTLDGAVVLSGYPSDLYEAHLPGWQRYETRALADGARARTEALWLNEAAAHRQPQLFGAMLP